MKIAHQVSSGAGRHDIILAFTLRHEKRTVRFTYQAPGGKSQIDICVNALSVGVIDPERDLVIEGFGVDAGHRVYLVRINYDSRERVGQIQLFMDECLHCGNLMPSGRRDTFCPHECGKRIR